MNVSYVVSLERPNTLLFQRIVPTVRVLIIIRSGCMDWALEPITYTKVVPMFSKALPRYRTVWGSWGIVPCIFNIGTRRMWVISFTLPATLPHGTAFYLIWCWVDPRAHFDASENRKIPCFYQELNPDSSAFQSVTNAIPTELIWLPTLKTCV